MDGDRRAGLTLCLRNEWGANEIGAFLKIPSGVNTRDGLH
jgi:hypothetical protein